MQRPMWVVLGLVSLSMITAASSIATEAGDGVMNVVQLDLQISGLAGEGCDVEIRPANSSSRFDPLVVKVPANRRSGTVFRAETIEVPAESLSADRNCAFSIVVKEPNRPAQVFKRAVRLEVATNGKPTPVRPLSCHLQAGAIASSEAAKKTRR